MGLPLPEEIMNQNQEQIPKGSAEISATTKDCRMCPHILLFNYPIWPIQKTDGSQRMTVDYHKHDQVVTLMATVPDAVSLCEYMNAYPVTWYAVVNLANAFFSKPAHKDHQRQLTFSCQGQQHTFTVLPQGLLTLQPCVIAYF